MLWIVIPLVFFSGSSWPAMNATVLLTKYCSVSKNCVQQSSWLCRSPAWLKCKHRCTSVESATFTPIFRSIKVVIPKVSAHYHPSSSIEHQIRCSCIFCCVCSSTRLRSCLYRLRKRLNKGTTLFPVSVALSIHSFTSQIHQTIKSAKWR